MIREGIGMSSLSVELLLGEFLLLLCKLLAFMLVLLPFLTFVRRTNHVLVATPGNANPRVVLELRSGAGRRF
jgi:hypothetical protein